MRDQQDSIKKIGTKIEDKLMKGGTLITLPDDLQVNITNETYQVIKANPQQMAAISTKDLTAPFDKDMEYINQQRQVIQWMLGITNSFQGQTDTTAQSGVAKQIQVQQASGRMRSKEFNKQTAFKELFEILFEFKLAFYDELRPYLSKDANGQTIYGDFDKYQFLMKDASGESFYNTDFLFEADAGSGIPKDPLFLFNQANNMLQDGAIDKAQFWTIMESLNFPMAKEIKSQVEQQMQNQSPKQDIPSLSISFKDLPPSGQAQMAQLAGIQLNPNDIQQMQAMQPPQQQAHPIDQLITQLPQHEQQQFKKMTPEQQKVITDQLMAEMQQQGGQ
jgi:hypothetical protein